MPYDDEGSLRFRDWEDFAILWQRVAGNPENVTIGQLLALAGTVHKVVGARRAGEVEMAELSAELRARGLGALPFQTVVAVLEATESVGAEEDILDKLTLREVQRMIDR